jgi:hypothetical protein
MVLFVTLEEAEKNITIANIIILIAGLAIAIAATVIHFDNEEYGVIYRSFSGDVAVGDIVGINANNFDVLKYSKADYTHDTIFKHSLIYNAVNSTDQLFVSVDSNLIISVYDYDTTTRKLTFNYDNNTNLTTGQISGDGTSFVSVEYVSAGIYNFTARLVGKTAVTTASTYQLNVGTTKTNTATTVYFFSGKNYGVFPIFYSPTSTLYLQGFSVNAATGEIIFSPTLNFFDYSTLDNSISRQYLPIDDTRMLALYVTSSKTYAHILTPSVAETDVAISTTDMFQLPYSSAYISIYNSSEDSYGFINANSTGYQGTYTLTHVKRGVVTNSENTDLIPMMEYISQYSIDPASGAIVVNGRTERDGEISVIFKYTSNSVPIYTNVLKYGTTIPTETNETVNGKIEKYVISINSVHSEIVNISSNYTYMYNPNTATYPIGTVISVSGKTVKLSLLNSLSSHPNETFVGGPVSIGKDGVLVQYINNSTQNMGIAIDAQTIFHL